MSEQTQHADDLEKLASLVKNIEYGMMTTTGEDGRLYSRPMAHNGNVEFDGDVWFFTYAASPKVHSIETRPQVNVTFASPEDQVYVSLAGRAALVQDKQKMADLWTPSLNAWFPNALETDDIALLKVTVESAEFWDVPSSVVAHVVSFAKSMVSGEPGGAGDNRKITIG